MNLLHIGLIFETIPTFANSAEIGFVYNILAMVYNINLLLIGLYCRVVVKGYIYAYW